MGPWDPMATTVSHWSFPYYKGDIPHASSRLSIRGRYVVSEAFSHGLMMTDGNWVGVPVSGTSGKHYFGVCLGAYAKVVYACTSNIYCSSVLCE